MIQWNKTSKREDTQTAKRKVWKSKCGHYKIEQSAITYGAYNDKRGNFLGYPPYYRAMVLRDWGWTIFSIHRKRSAAQKQLEHLHEHGVGIPTKKRKRKVNTSDID